jgi:hypothetical protein
MRTSVGQAAANSVAAWLTASLSPDVTVLAQWPTSTQLPVNANGRVKVVSVTKVGKRRRIDANLPMAPLSLSPTGSASARATFPIGIYIQPLQIDVWCAYEVDRDDLIDQLDDVLNVGVDQTLGSDSIGPLTDDPVRDGVVLPLAEENGYTGYLDCWFDEPDTEDNPNTIERVEFRATYAGEAHGAFARIREVPILKAATLKLKTSESPAPPPAIPFDTTTITMAGGTFVVTGGESSS